MVPKLLPICLFYMWRKRGTVNTKLSKVTTFFSFGNAITVMVNTKLFNSYNFIYYIYTSIKHPPGNLPPLQQDL